MASLDTLSGLWSVSGEDVAVQGTETSWRHIRERRGSLERSQAKTARRFSYDNDLRDVRFLSYDGISTNHQTDFISSSEPSDTDSCGHPANQRNSVKGVGVKSDTLDTDNNIYHVQHKSQVQIYDSDDSGTAGKATSFRKQRELEDYGCEQQKIKGLKPWTVSGEFTYNSNGESTRSTLQKIKKTTIYDSDDSGTVCGEEECTSSGSSSGEEPVDKFEQRFGHLFKQDLPPPRPQTMSSHFNFVPARCSKRTAPLPPLPPNVTKSTLQQRPEEFYRNMPRSRSSNALQSFIESSGLSASASVSYRKSLKRRLSLAGLFLPSKLVLSRMPEYFTQTAPGTLQSPSKMSLLNNQEICSPSYQRSCTTNAGPFCESSTTSSESVSCSSSFNSNSSLGENSVITVVPPNQFVGYSRSINSYSDFSSSGSSTFSTSSWGTSSFSSLQTLGNQELVEFDESGFKSLSPPIGAGNNYAPSRAEGGWRTPKLATILPSGHRGSLKSLRETNPNKDTRGIPESICKFRRERCSSEGGGIDYDDEFVTKKFHSNQHKRFTSLSRRQRLRRSIKKMNSGLKGNVDYSTMTGSSKKKSLRQWLYSVTSKREGGVNIDNRVWIGQDSKSNSDSEMDDDSSRCWNPQYKDGLAKSRSETALNQMLDQLDVKTTDSSRAPEPPPKLEKSRWSRSLTELRLFTGVQNVPADASVDLSRSDDEDWYLKHTRIIVLPHDTNLTEPPIYENVTCVIKPKPPSKPLASTLKKSLPISQMSNPEVKNEVSNGRGNTATKETQAGSFTKTSKVSITRSDNRYQSSKTANNISELSKSENFQQAITKSLTEICIPDDGDDSSLQKSAIDPDSQDSNAKDTGILVSIDGTNEKSPVLAELRKSKQFSKTQDCFNTMQSSFTSQPSSPVRTRKFVSPRQKGTVKELIQRFSSMENLSHLNHTLPCRTPNRKFISVKSKVRGTVSNELSTSIQYESAATKKKYNTWDRKTSMELRQSMSFNDDNQSEKCIVADPTSPESTNITIISVPDLKSSQTPDHTTLKDKDSSLEICFEKHHEESDDDSPFTEMIKNSRVLKSLQNRLPGDESNVKESFAASVETKVDKDDSEVQIRNTSRNGNKIDLIRLRETRRRRLSLNTSLCSSNLPTHEEEATFLETGTKSMNFLTDLRYCMDTDNFSFKADREFEDAPENDQPRKNSACTHVKRSPFQKFKDSLYNSFHSHGSKNVYSAASDFQPDQDFDQKGESNGKKLSRRQAYIQLKSLRTWKDVTKSSKNKQGTGTIESQSTILNANGSSRPSSDSSSTMSSRYHYGRTFDGVSDFSSNNSSLRSNRSLASEFYSRAPVDENWNRFRGQRSFSTGSPDENSWKFDPICHGEGNHPFGSLESSNSIHDRDRSITYSSHQANKIYQSSDCNNYGPGSHSSHYTKLFKNPKKYFKPPSFAFNLSITTPQPDPDVGKYNQRRHSLSDFSPEISTNEDHNLARKLTPSTLYPLTLSPTPPSRDQVDWATRRQQLPPPPPPPTFKPGQSPTTAFEFPPLKSSPSLPLPAGPGDFSLPLRHTTSLGYAPFFCTRDVNSVQEISEKDARGMPPPMKYSGLNKNRSSQPRSLLQSEK